MRVLKGIEVTKSMKVKAEEELKKLSRVPKLAIVRVGENPDDISYEKGALKRMEGFGLRAETYTYDKDIADADFKAEFAKINADEDIDGILLLRPLPKHLDSQGIEEMMDPAKDVDGITKINAAKVFLGEKDAYEPCTAQAVMEVLDYAGVELKGKRAVVIGRSAVVGKPLSMLLLGKHATVTICHSRTENLPEVCKEADVLVACVGKAGMVDASYVKDGAVVVDVGINVNEEGKLCGDVKLEQLEEIASIGTPVPGGVGGVTTAVLADHVIRAAKIKEEHFRS